MSLVWPLLPLLSFALSFLGPVPWRTPVALRIEDVEVEDDDEEAEKNVEADEDEGAGIAEFLLGLPPFLEICLAAGSFP